MWLSPRELPYLRSAVVIRQKANGVYAYAAGNPISYRDATGKDPLLAVIGALAGTGYGIVNGIIAGDSRDELIADAIAGASQGGLITLTDGLSLLQGAVVNAGIESYRQIANSAVTGWLIQHRASLWRSLLAGCIGFIVCPIIGLAAAFIIANPL
jgi:hypothetical protein